MSHISIVNIQKKLFCSLTTEMELDVLYIERAKQPHNGVAYSSVREYVKLINFNSLITNMKGT